MKPIVPNKCTPRCNCTRYFEYLLQIYSKVEANPQPPATYDKVFSGWAKEIYVKPIVNVVA